MSKSASSKRYALLQERMYILAHRRAVANESRLYQGGRSSDTSLRVINATGSVRTRSHERWVLKNKNLDTPVLRSGGVTIG